MQTVAEWTRGAIGENRPDTGLFKLAMVMITRVSRTMKAC